MTRDTIKHSNKGHNQTHDKGHNLTQGPGTQSNSVTRETIKHRDQGHNHSDMGHNLTQRQETQSNTGTRDTITVTRDTIKPSDKGHNQAQQQGTESTPTRKACVVLGRLTSMALLLFSLPPRFLPSLLSMALLARWPSLRWDGWNTYITCCETAAIRCLPWSGWSTLFMMRWLRRRI